jgi:GTP-binding protein Era
MTNSDQSRDPGETPPAAAGDAPARPSTRCGFVAIIGAPNAGKSTLVNRLVGTKVTIVSRKVQTTRMPVRGLVLIGDTQLVLIDTPGIFAPRRRLDRAMVGAAWTGANDADAIVWLIDAARGLEAEARAILEKLKSVRPPVYVALNKVDRLADKAALLPLAIELQQQLAPADLFFISALDGDGVDDLKVRLAEAMPEGRWHYPPDDVSDLPMRLLAAELTREKIYDRLHQELPYSITVETTDWKTLRDGSARIEQTIFVERDSQRKIVLGKGGSLVKKVSQETRSELAAILETKVHLFLFVKVREHWADDPARYREMGLEFPKD